jgi:hypothetical protein
VARLCGTVPIVETPRTQPMPHGGYRAFAITASTAAFPDFSYTPLSQGLARTIAEAKARAAG